MRQAEDAYNRLKKVHSEGGISDVRWIEMETDLEKARQAEVAARKRVEDCVIRAPFDGVVSCRNHHVGEEMRPMEPFARVLDLRRLRVGFSVQLACLSAKHFSAVIKEETGHTAAHWIHNQVVAEAKMLLHMRHDLTVQAISDMLGFDEQASFSRYFRRETGLYPTEFRTSN